ncbi:hypothetical protein RDI58_017736 [Solanum bulbocastanum]|uniref:Uncharacterized protein n=1 Tax=Solanum bulbocastanum TaxID=147425 RepID=A0AAN8TG01_SOLBU
MNPLIAALPSLLLDWP